MCGCSTTSSDRHSILCFVNDFKMAGRSAEEVACFVFQKYYKSLISGLQVHLPMIAVHLFSEGLVSADNRDKTLDNNTSQLEKCMCLLKDVEDRIRRNHSVLDKFCEVLCSQEIGLSDLGDPMLHDFQQLCPNPTIPGTHNTVNERFIMPTSESQADTLDEGLSNIQPSRSDKYGISDDAGSRERAALIRLPFKPTQDTDGDIHTYYGSELEQVVPQKESGHPAREKAVTPFVSLVDSDHCDVGHSVQDRDCEEDRLVSDLVLSWDRVKFNRENLASVKAEYQKKLQDTKEYYDTQSKRLKPSVTKSASFRHVRKLKEDQRILLRAMQIQSKEDRIQLEENELKIEELELQVEKQMSELMESQRLLEMKKKEQKKLKVTLSSKERELHELNQSAKHCPVYRNKKRRAHFEQKKELCEEIQSLVAIFFSTCNVDKKSKLHKEIQAKFVHFTPLKRCRSF